MNKNEFTDLLSSGTKTMLIDIREPEELLVEETIPGSKNIPMGKVFTSAADGTLAKDVPIVVFCRSGKRAAVVAKELTADGFNVQALEGGLHALRTNE